MSNVICWNNIYKRFKIEIVQSSFLLVDGMLQKEKNTSHLIASNIVDVSKLLKLIPGIE
jgi:DNA polymerase III alpha subunit